MANRLKSLGIGGISLAIALALSACGSSPPSATGSTTTTVASTSTSVAPTTTSGPSVPECSTGVLSLSESSGGATAGSSFDTFSVMNGGPSTCQLDGYPSLTFFGPTPGGGAGAGAKLALTGEHGGPAPTAVSLKAGASADFLVVFSDVPVGGGCTTVASVEMTPPGSTESISAPVSFSPCGPTVKVYAFGVSGSESP